MLQIDSSAPLLGSGPRLQATGPNGAPPSYQACEPDFSPGDGVLECVEGWLGNFRSLITSPIIPRYRMPKPLYPPSSSAPPQSTSSRPHAGPPSRWGVIRARAWDRFEGWVMQLQADPGGPAGGAGNGGSRHARAGSGWESVNEDDFDEDAEEVDPSALERSSSSIPIIVDDKSHGNSVTEAVYHLICVIAGSGVLQLPYALNQSGWIGILIVLFAAWANNYSGKLLVKCLYANGSERLPSFPHVGELAFGHKGKMLVEIFNTVMLVGVPVVYLILSGMNLELLFGVFSTRVWIIICSLVVLVPFLIFKTLKEIAILSAFGVFATVVVIATVVFYSVGTIATGDVPVEHKFVDVALFPSALGSISFSYAGNFVYPEVESSMADPSKFPVVLFLSMTLISIMYLLTAVVGYWAYGSATVSPILNNLPPGLSSRFAIGVITLHVLLAIPVLITTLSLEVERRLSVERPGRGKAMEGGVRSVVRCGIVALVCVLAMAVPFFADFMTLLGAIANTNLIFVFPILFDFKIFGFWKRPLRDRLVGLIILSVGLYGGFVGGGEAIMALVNDFRTGASSGRGGH